MSIPRVETGEATGVTGTTATLHGSAFFTPGPPYYICDRVGFQWGETPEYGESWDETGLWFNDLNFSHTIEGLSPGTTYYFRAFAWIEIME